MNAFQTKMSQQGFMEEFDDQDLLLRPQPKGRQDQQARPERFRRILAPVDLSERTVDALRCASAFADKADAVLEVLHVVHLSISDEEKGIPRSNLIRSLSEAAQRELHDRSIVPGRRNHYHTVRSRRAAFRG